MEDGIPPVDVDLLEKLMEESRSLRRRLGGAQDSSEPEKIEAQLDASAVDSLVTKNG